MRPSCVNANDLLLVETATKHWLAHLTQGVYDLVPAMLQPANVIANQVCSLVKFASTPTTAGREKAVVTTVEFVYQEGNVNASIHSQGICVGKSAT